MLGTMSVRRALGVLSVKPGVCAVQVRRNTQNGKDWLAWPMFMKKHFAAEYAAAKEQGLLEGMGTRESMTIVAQKLEQKYRDMQGEGAAKGHEEVKEDASVGGKGDTLPTQQREVLDAEAAENRATKDVICESMKKPTTMEGASREEVKEDAVANAVETVKEALELQEKQVHNVRDETYWLKQKEKHLANVEKARLKEVRAKETVALLQEQHAGLVLKEKKEAVERNASLLKEKERASLLMQNEAHRLKERRPKMAALRKRVAWRSVEKAAALQVRKTEKALLASSGPFTAHTLFIKKTLTGTNGKISAHTMKDVYAKWKALPAQQREVFEAEAAENRAKRAAVRESMKSLKNPTTKIFALFNRKHFAAEYAAAKEQGILEGLGPKERMTIVSRLVAQKYREMQGEGAAKGHEEVKEDASVGGKGDTLTTQQREVLEGEAAENRAKKDVICESMKKPTTMEGASREEVKEDAVANAVETVKEALLKLEKEYSAYAEDMQKKHSDYVKDMQMQHSDYVEASKNTVAQLRASESELQHRGVVATSELRDAERKIEALREKLANMKPSSDDGPVSPSNCGDLYHGNKSAAVCTALFCLAFGLWHVDIVPMK